MNTVIIACLAILVGSFIAANIFFFQTSLRASIAVYICCCIAAIVCLPITAYYDDLLHFGLVLFMLFALVIQGWELARILPTSRAFIPQPSAYQRRAARLLKNGGSHTNAEWLALCRQYKGRCVACKRRAKLTKDHVIPVSMGGRDDIANIQPLCLECNTKKGTRTIDYRVSQP